MNPIETEGFIKNAQNPEFPQEAKQAFNIIQSLLGKTVVGVYLFGSAVVGGLHPNSDVDVPIADPDLAIILTKVQKECPHAGAYRFGVARSGSK
jgi:hypothetical protein